MTPGAGANRHFTSLAPYTCGIVLAYSGSSGHRFSPFGRSYGAGKLGVERWSEKTKPEDCRQEGRSLTVTRGREKASSAGSSEAVFLTERCTRSGWPSCLTKRRIES